MALGDFKLFQFKSKEQAAQEAAEYEIWAFPHGEKQRENLLLRLKELNPKEAEKLMLISFLTCKELYEAAVKETESDEDAIKTLIAKASRFKQLIHKKDLTMYTAAVIADAAVDENCEYPTVAQLREHMREIDEMLQKKK
ncbi:MAG: hypothetical protein FWC20_01000 [Oscillospiraceae bacterium]|nr:hypothetical protein [Oscillospiraceae bacterium]MCL2277970.1 hypothetical protein [Oscillospiraceae bacterium]